MMNSLAQLDQLPPPRRRPRFNARTFRPAAATYLAGLFLFTVLSPMQQFARSAEPPKNDLAQYEQRIRGIYDRREFRDKPFTIIVWNRKGDGFFRKEIDPDTNVESTTYYDATTGTPQATDELPADPTRSPDGKHRLSTKHGRLVVRAENSDQETVLSQNEPDGPIVCEKASWSPDGSKIAFVEEDSTRVPTRLMLVKTDPSYPTSTTVRFARVGEIIPSLRVGIANADGTGTKWIELPAPPEGFLLGIVEWAGSSDEVLIEWLSRFRDERRFLLWNSKTGKTTSIFEERDPAWIDSSIAKNLGMQWIDGGKQFVVISEKDGWRRAYVYDRSGKELRAITPPKCDLIERCFIDEARGLYYYYASPENGTQKYLYRAPLDGKTSPSRVTPVDQAGTHEYRFSPDGRLAVHTYSSFDRPPVVDLVEMPEHRVLHRLEENAAVHARMKELGSRPVEFLKLPIESETAGRIEMDAWMLTPRDFDAKKSYPVFVYVYGEPHAQTVLDQWGAGQSHFHRAIADLGYVVVSIDNRGTPCPKGAAWRRSIFGSLGPLSTIEQAAGLRELARQKPFVDLKRSAIWGWSGGGSNTLNAMFRQPELYQVGIAVVPKPQPHLYNAKFQEIYMRDRKVNEEGYRRSAPLNFAEGLQGKLLIIHGGGETNTHLEIVEGLVDRLIELGKPFDFMVYPNLNHGLREGKGSTVDVYMRIARYLTLHLPPGPR